MSKIHLVPGTKIGGPIHYFPDFSWYQVFLDLNWMSLELYNATLINKKVRPFPYIFFYIIFNYFDNTATFQCWDFMYVSQQVHSSKQIILLICVISYQTVLIRLSHSGVKIENMQALAGCIFFKALNQKRAELLLIYNITVHKKCTFFSLSRIYFICLCYSILDNMWYLHWNRCSSDQ